MIWQEMPTECQKSASNRTFVRRRPYADIIHYRSQAANTSGYF